MEILNIKKLQIKRPTLNHFDLLIRDFIMFWFLDLITMISFIEVEIKALWYYYLSVVPSFQNLWI